MVTLAGLGMMGPFATDAIFPAFHRFSADFGVTEAALQQLISVYLLAYAAMSLLHGPLSDAWGRKPVIIAGLAMFVASSAAAAFAPNLTVLLVCRALQGVSAGAGQIVSRAQVRDVFEGDRAQQTMSQISMIFVLGPALAPVIGGLLLGWGAWAGIFWFQAAYGLALLLLVALATPETHPPSRRTPFDARSLFRSLWQVWKRPRGRRLALIAGLAFGGQFLLISAASIFIMTLLGKGENDFWMLFVPMMGGVMAGSWVSGRLAGRVPGRRLVSVGYAVGLAGGALLVAFALIPATAVLPWIVLPIPVYTFGISLAFPTLTIAMLDLYPNARGAASSVQSFVSLLCNAVVAGVLAPLLGLWLPTLMLGALAFLVAAASLWTWHLHVLRRRALEKGTKMDTYLLSNDAFRVTIAPFGATLHRFEVHRPEGWRNIVLSRPDPTHSVFGYLGATVGRFANRIGGAEFTLDGVRHQLAANEGRNQLHGGPGGVHAQVWDVAEADDAHLVLHLTSPDGDQGYPGTMRLTATFRLVDGGAEVEYRATTDAPTVVNLTAHPYFNLNGDGFGTVDTHLLQVPASRYTPVDGELIPTGEIADVDGTGLDLREPRLIVEARADLVAGDLADDGGFDHNLIVDGTGLREHVRLVGPDGLTLVVRSDAPAVQLYDGANLDGRFASVDGRPYVCRSGLAIEPQNYPDAPNHPNFPDPTLRPGQEYRTLTQWLVR